MIAIILAAGVGARMRPMTEHLPKALIKVNKKPIIFRLLEDLIVQPQIDKIVIVVGFRAALLKTAVSSEFPGNNICFVENTAYLDTNNMYSLFLGLTHLKKPSDMLIINGDVLFDKSIIENITNDIREDLIACDCGAYLSESMKITVSGGLVTGISKTIVPENAYGVSIDLYKLSVTSVENLHEICRRIIMSGTVNQWTEVALNELLESGLYPAVPLDITGIWWEIDNRQDWTTAELLFRKEGGIPEIMNKSLFVFDFDGTMVLDAQPTPGALEFIEMLKELGKQVVIISNNSSRGVDGFRSLASTSLKYKFSPDEVFSTTHSTIIYLKKNDISRVFVVGTVAFAEDLIDAEIMCNSVFDKDIFGTRPDPQMVVIAFDTELTYWKLRNAVLLIRKGIPYIVTHEDILCPTKDGMIPDAGAILALIKSATNVEPIAVLGKPSVVMLKSAIGKTDVEDVVLFGDRLYTDIAMANALGVTSALVLTGGSKVVDVIQSDFRPDFVFKDFTDLLKYWNIANH